MKERHAQSNTIEKWTMGLSFAEDVSCREDIPACAPLRSGLAAFISAAAAATSISPRFSVLSSIYSRASGFFGTAIPPGVPLEDFTSADHLVPRLSSQFSGCQKMTGSFFVHGLEIF